MLLKQVVDINGLVGIETSWPHGQPAPQVAQPMSHHTKTMYQHSYHAHLIRKQTAMQPTLHRSDDRYGFNYNHIPKYILLFKQ